ncbi:hypothetical protein AB0M20_26110, partial [Actinoplanes sp. NPDC051633]
MAHGGHAIADDAPGAEQLTKLGWTKLSDATQGENSTTDFDYLFHKLVGDQEAHLPAATAAEVNLTVHALNDLGDLMIDQEPPAADTSSPIPPVYTYWGQFIDHDLTAATDGDGVISIRDVPLPPLDADEVRRLLKNARNPALNLDSLYGDGPFAPPPTDPAKVVVPYQEDRAKLAVGRLRFVPFGVRIPPVDDMDRDLPRTDTGEPLVGDQRNDENLVVAQLHVAFLRFHNMAVDWVRAYEPERTSVEDVFYRAQQLT